jgi:carbamoyl-phosphate synthase large subunit
MGIDRTFDAALEKALLGAGIGLKPGAAILISLSGPTKVKAIPLIEQLHKSGCRMYATEGTSTFIRALGPDCTTVTKVLTGSHPNVVDVIRDGTVSAVINTPEGRYTGSLRDGFYIRRAAAEKRIPCFTWLDTARVAVEALGRAASYNVMTLREYVE